MSELILTQEEKKSLTWLTLPDKTIADVTRHMGTIFKKVHTEQEIKDTDRPLFASAAMHICIQHALEAYTETEADKISIDFTDLELSGKVFGNWRLTIEKIETTETTETTDDTITESTP